MEQQIRTWVFTSMILQHFFVVAALPKTHAGTRLRLIAMRR